MARQNEIHNSVSFFLKNEYKIYKKKKRRAEIQQLPMCVPWVQSLIMKSNWNLTNEIPLLLMLAAQNKEM